MSSPAATDGPRSASARPHQRTYQACIPCRLRKVRCDLGDIDHPHDPPCKRCRRETKECYFSATRRKRRNSNGEERLETEEDDDYAMRNGRKRGRSSNPQDAQDSSPVSSSSTKVASTKPVPLTPGGSAGQKQPLRQPPTKQEPKSDEDDQQASNEMAAVLQTGEIFGGYDALNLLYEASRRAGARDARPTSSQSGPGSAPLSPLGQFMHREVAPHVQQHTSANGSTTAAPNPRPEEVGLRRGLHAWSKFRFVRAGWITAREGIEYVQYFYDHLSILTPLVIPNYHDPATHDNLLNNEPMLAVTILTITSRYMKLVGPGGSSRGYSIHSKLWEYLQGMIDRIMWGQEQFGGGFCGAGAQSGSDVNPLQRKGLRTLGTVLSLMLLTEWHPRALHFPPGDDDDELMIPDDANALFQSSSSNRESTLRGEDGGQRIDSWLEPCWRSDRMCWMLLSIATSLAVEIGVFDESSWRNLAHDNPNSSPQEILEYSNTRRHLKELLQIYVTQTAGRLGLTSVLPAKYMEDAFEATPAHRLQNRIRSLSSHSDAPSVSPRGLEQFIQLNPVEMVLHHFVDLAAIMHAGNKQAFPSRRVTRELIASGRYRAQLASLQPAIDSWRAEFDNCTTIPTPMRLIMEIEFEYTKVYINSLALHAVVERCTHGVRAQGSQGRFSSGSGEAISTATLHEWIDDDRIYIRQVVDGCRRVLQIVAEDLGPKGLLRHLPVRTYFRIISVAIILLKTFALGAPEDDVVRSLDFMDQATAALRENIVDDVHVINNFCDLCDNLKSRIRPRLVRMAAYGSKPEKWSKEKHKIRNANRHGSSAALAGNVPITPKPGGPGLYPGNTSTYTSNPPIMSSHTPESPLLYTAAQGTYDPESNLSIVPPPTFTQYTSTNGNSNVDFPMSYASGYASDWLALPLDPLVNDQFGANITQTMYGPMVNGHDLMDVLLPQHTQPQTMDGSWFSRA